MTSDDQFDRMLGGAGTDFLPQSVSRDLFLKGLDCGATIGLIEVFEPQDGKYTPRVDLYLNYGHLCEELEDAMPTDKRQIQLKAFEKICEQSEIEDKEYWFRLYMSR